MPRDQITPPQPALDLLRVLPDAYRVRSCSGGDSPHHAALAAALRAFGEGLAVLSGTESRTVICPRTDLAVEGPAGANAGLVALRMRALKDAVVVDSELAGPHWSEPVRATLWAVAERLFDLELPRHVVLTAGDRRFSIHADRSGARGASGGEIAAAIRTAVEQAAAVDVTLADPDAPCTGSTTDLAELFGAATGPWSLDPDGWPVALPAGATLAKVRAANALARAVQPFETSQVRLIGPDNVTTQFFLDGRDVASASYRN